MSNRAPRFSGFARETFQFLSDLQQNNSKHWFEANRARYESTWKSPALDLIAALAAPMATLDPPLKAEVRLNGSLRRINRDVRFSRNKSPYKPRLHMIFWSGSHPNRSPAMHFVLNPHGLGYGAGAFGLAPADLQALRDRIVDRASRKRLLTAIARATAAGCSLGKPDLTRLPKGYETDGDWEFLLRHKSFVMRTRQDTSSPDWIFTDDCLGQLMSITHELMPLIRWLSP
ncbi:MAG: TIGR02453 family protein [Paracoccaceae bacterium]